MIVKLMIGVLALQYDHAALDGHILSSTGRSQGGLKSAAIAW